MGRTISRPYDEFMAEFDLLISALAHARHIKSQKKRSGSLSEFKNNEKRKLLADKNKSGIRRRPFEVTSTTLTMERYRYCRYGYADRKIHRGDWRGVQRARARIRIRCGRAGTRLGTAAMRLSTGPDRGSATTSRRRTRLH